MSAQFHSYHFWATECNRIQLKWLYKKKFIINTKRQWKIPKKKNLFARRPLILPVTTKKNCRRSIYYFSMFSHVITEWKFTQKLCNIYRTQPQFFHYRIKLYVLQMTYRMEDELWEEKKIRAGNDFIKWLHNHFLPCPNQILFKTEFNRKVNANTDILYLLP